MFLILNFKKEKKEKANSKQIEVKLARAFQNKRVAPNK